MSAFSELLGNDLVKGTETVAVESALAGKEIVGLYFSAHWCPPCKGYTPKLAEQYKAVAAAGKSFEVIFVSSDRDEASFKEYFGEMPWLALPYAARKTKAALSKKYKVNGIPTLILLDGATGELLNKDGRSAVMEIADFPWRPPTLWDCLGEEVLGHDGDVEVADLRKEGGVLGLYFSAHWCPPCRGFTPELVKTYSKLKEAGKHFEVIFVSSDRSASDFQEYFGTMPWLAIPNGDKRKEKLSTRFEVEGIPTFVLLDAKTGAIINSNGCSAVGSDPEGLQFPWVPPAIGDMSMGVDGINESACLCLMLEGLPKEAQTELVAKLTPVAEASLKSKQEVLFFAATSGGPTEQIRKLTQLGDPSPAAQLILLDIPDEGGFYTHEGRVTADALTEFLSAYKAGTLTRKQLEK